MDVGDIFLWGVCLCGYRRCWASDDNGQLASYQSLTGGVHAEYHPIAVFQKEVVENHLKKEQQGDYATRDRLVVWKVFDENAETYSPTGTENHPAPVAKRPSSAVVCEMSEVSEASQHDLYEVWL